MTCFRSGLTDIALVFVCQDDLHEPLLNSFSQLKDVLCSVAGTYIGGLMPDRSFTDVFCILH